MSDKLNMNVQRIAVPHPALDEAEELNKRALAQIEEEYRKAAEPFLKRLAEIESMRVYRYVVIPA